MPSQTPNLDLYKVNGETDGNDTFNVDVVLNDNWDKIDAAVGTIRTELNNSVTAWGVSSNNGNNYSVELDPAPESLEPGFSIRIKINATSTGAPTLNVNGLGAKPVLKASGSAASFKANGVYTLVYDGTAFTLQGEGGEVGTATAPDVLQGKTFPGEDGLITGTMKDLRGTTLSKQWQEGITDIRPLPEDPNGQGQITFNTNDFTDGRIDKTTKQVIAVSGLLAQNIKHGVKVGNAGGAGITGTFTSDALLDPQYLLIGYSGYDDGVKKMGTMPHLTGVRTATGVAKWGDGALAVYPEKGYQKGGVGDGEIKVSVAQLQSAEPNLSPGNILSGKSIYGIVGTLAQGKKFMQGSVTPNANGYYVIPVNGFTPSRGFMWQGDGSGWGTGNNLYMGCMPTNPDGTPNLTPESGSAVVIWDTQLTYVSNGFTQPNNVFFPGSVFLRVGGKMSGTAKYILFE